MQLVNEFTVPTSADEAWNVLSDLDRVAPCLPGAVVDSREGDEYRGHVAVKVGPVGLSFSGVAAVLERDAQNRRLVVQGAADDTRGQGGAQAHITVTVAESGAGADVRVVTELGLTGKVAQFGTGLINQVNRRIMRQFTDRLDAMLRDAGEVAPQMAGRTAVSPPGRHPYVARAGGLAAVVVAGVVFGLAVARAVHEASRR